MKPYLLPCGIAFLLLGFILLIIGLVIYFASRGRRGKPVAASAQIPVTPGGGAAPYAAATPPPPPAPPAFSPPPPPVAAGHWPPAPSDATAPTIMVNVRASTGGTLYCDSGPLAGRTFPIDANGVYIGRDGTVSQIVIDDSRVSKRHVWIGVRDGVVMAIDQSSTNGTYLNTLSARIAEERLAPGDIVIVSDDVARFVYRQ